MIRSNAWLSAHIRRSLWGIVPMRALAAAGWGSRLVRGGYRGNSDADILHLALLFPRVGPVGEHAL
jgi:hypothetical protein